MKIPNLTEPELWYETGVHIGDGSMFVRDGTYSVTYWGNSITDKKYFEDVLVPLIRKLYGFKTKVQHSENTVYIRIFSKELTKFKSTKLKLPSGQKSKINSLPKFFFLNGNQNVNQLVSGIFDTDGTVKIIKRKNGLYPRLRFTLKNKGIILQIKKFLKKFDITSTHYHDRRFDYRIKKRKDTWDLDINGFTNLKKFVNNFKIKNPNNLRKIKILLESK